MDLNILLEFKNIREKKLEAQLRDQKRAISINNRNNNK